MAKCNNDVIQYALPHNKFAKFPQFLKTNNDGNGDTKGKKKHYI